MSQICHRPQFQSQPTPNLKTNVTGIASKLDCRWLSYPPPHPRPLLSHLAPHYLKEFRGATYASFATVFPFCVPLPHAASACPQLTRPIASASASPLTIATSHRKRKKKKIYTCHEKANEQSFSLEIGKKGKGPAGFTCLGLHGWKGERAALPHSQEWFRWVKPRRLVL